VLVSPGPRGGYRLLDFSSASFGALLVGEGKDTFRWVPPGAGGPALVAPGGNRWASAAISTIHTTVIARLNCLFAFRPIKRVPSVR
jgi:hypothetical protein